jgi:hypothetical protein
LLCSSLLFFAPASSISSSSITSYHSLPFPLSSSFLIRSSSIDCFPPTFFNPHVFFVTSDISAPALDASFLDIVIGLASNSPSNSEDLAKMASIHRQVEQGLAEVKQDLAVAVVAAEKDGKLYAMKLAEKDA